MWVELLVRLRFFGTRQAASRRLLKLERTGRLACIGRLSPNGCRPSHLWSNRAIPNRLLRHEFDVMRVFYAFWPHAYAVTGSDVDDRYRADMELTIGSLSLGRTYMVEVDEGTESHAQARSRLSGYDHCPRSVLVVTTTAERAKGILRLTENPRVYATTLDACLRDPWGSHWRNCRNEAGRLTRPASSDGEATSRNGDRG